MRFGAELKRLNLRASFVTTQSKSAQIININCHQSTICQNYDSIWSAVRYNIMIIPRCELLPEDEEVIFTVISAVQ